MLAAADFLTLLNQQLASVVHEFNPRTYQRSRSAARRTAGEKRYGEAGCMAGGRDARRLPV